MGLYNYGQRYYAPWLCRFVSVDPIAEDYPQYTSYNYAGNKPVTKIDLEGLQEKGAHSIATKGTGNEGDGPQKGNKNPEKKFSYPQGDYSLFGDLIHALGSMVKDWFTQKHKEGVKNIDLVNEVNITLSNAGVEEHGSEMKAKVYLYPFVSDLAEYTSGDDASVITEGKHLKGEKATKIDYVLAYAAVLLPISGSSIKKVLGKVWDELPSLKTVSKASQKHLKGRYEFHIDSGRINFADQNLDLDQPMDFIITDSGELRIGQGHWAMAEEGVDRVKMAGMLTLENGKITSIDNWSGHYNVTKESLADAANLFKSMGLTNENFEPLFINFPDR